MLYFDKFPKIQYDLGDNSIVLTNLLFRVKVFDNFTNNMISYYDYVVPEGKTIEELAEQYYGNAEFHWIIILTNQLVDPLFDWHLRYTDLMNYIEDKYGSVSTAKSLIDHYELLTSRTSNNNEVTKTINIIDYGTFANTATYSRVVYNLSDGISDVEEVITTNTVYTYDMEIDANEKKRVIKLIKKEYLSQILNEFADLVKEGDPTSTTKRITGQRTLR